MGLFKKKITPDDLGSLLYSNLKYIVMSQGSALYHKKLITDFNEDPEEIKWSYFVEIIMFLIFCTFDALSKNCKFDKLKVIMDKIIDEFTNHLGPILKPELELTTKNYIIELLNTRLNEYGECLKNNTGAGPAWHLGLKAYWNIIGKEKEDPIAPTALSMYALEVENIVGKIISDHRIS